MMISYSEVVYDRLLWEVVHSFGPNSYLYLHTFSAYIKMLYAQSVSMYCTQFRRYRISGGWGWGGGIQGSCN